MSIIYEALKKVEADTNDKLVKAKHPSPDISSNVPQSPKKINLAFYALIAICTVSTILIAVGAYFSNRNSRLQTVKIYLDRKEIQKAGNETFYPAKAAIVEAKTETPEAGEITPAASKPAVNTQNLPVYILQGIVYDENSPFAIINGKTLRKSDTIDGFVVIDIAPTIVTLKNLKDDKELALSF